MQTKREMLTEGTALDPATLAKPVVWAEMFGNDRPVELEIGTGKGTFLTEQARTRPEVNFIGLEWQNWYMRYAADRLRRHGCTNGRMAKAEALFFLREHVPDASLSVIHVYFPDPWPKARHHKRRLVQKPFLEQVMRVLIPNGRLQVVTDHKGYFEENIDPVVKASPLTIVDYNRPGSAGEGEFVGTNFERKYKREGRPFYAVAGVKSGSDFVV
jgi:tRNA (guanine-N7-)-methyltransferase